jgi:hypothetical protein
LADNDQGEIHSVSEGGVIGEHPAPMPFKALVGPTTGTESNRIRDAPYPVLCWKVEDIRFDFDSSFVAPGTDPDTNPSDPTSDPISKPYTQGGIQQELKELAAQLQKHPGCPLSVFGHADPVGPAVDPDGYNKALSGRRATAIYALLISGTQASKAAGLWQTIAGQENWGQSQTQAMQQATGLPDGTSMSALISSYLPKLLPPEFVALNIGPANFLAQGADSHGKGDYQGCSSFNPLLIFSQEKQNSFAAGANDQDPDVYAARNLANAPNRRVMVLVFNKNAKVIPAQWPCPSATGDKSGCIKRFWSDGQTRRSTRLPDTDREYSQTQDTFACRFYDRLMNDSPCYHGNPCTVQITPTPLVVCAGCTGGTATETPTATGNPAGGDFAWSSGDTTIATVTGAGASATVKGSTPGTTTIKAAYTPDGPTCSATVPVIAVRVLLELHNTDHVTPAPENSTHDADVDASGGADGLGPLPMGQGRAEHPGKAYTSPLEVIATVTPDEATTLTYRWKRFITRRSWNIRHDPATKTWNVTQRTRRGFPSDDTGDDSFNDAVPNANGRMYIYDDSALTPESIPANRIGDYIYEEKDFTYRVERDNRGTFVICAEIRVGQIIKVRRIALTGTTVTDFAGLENSTAIRTVTATIDETKVRGIVGGTDAINIAANANH